VGYARVTPVDSFFVKQHIPRPAPINPAAYKLTINGIVSRPKDMSLADLKALPQFTVPATLECTGNGRGFYTPKVPGIQLEARRSGQRGVARPAAERRVKTRRHE
jgi:DMSO/TMAO reductase YedYZ molybdopterin-dependent catalytic subunit